MKSNKILTALFLLTSLAQADEGAKFKTNTGSVEPGTKVTARSSEVLLSTKGTFKKGTDLAKVVNQTLDYKIPSEVTLISVVPSIDTPVCDAQTHALGDSKLLSPTVKRITISRDLPMAQARFAETAKLNNITYLSDYKAGLFGNKTGLLLMSNELLARAVIVLDKSGKVAYYQVVPELSELPDMDRAIAEANKLSQVQ